MDKDRVSLRLSNAYASAYRIINNSSCCRAETRAYLAYLKEVKSLEYYSIKSRILYKDTSTNYKEEIDNCINRIKIIYRKYKEAIPDGDDIEDRINQILFSLEEYKAS